MAECVIIHDDRPGHYLQAQYLANMLQLPYHMMHYSDQHFTKNMALVISVGSKPMLAAWRYKRKLCCAWVQILGQGPVTVLPDLHIAPAHDQGWFWPVPATRLVITGAVLGAAYDKNERKNPTKIAVFMGGPARNMPCQPADYDDLLAKLRRLSKEYSLLISTSPRTPS
ncbi:MAG: ELM1/GtrOC1 family putative glycosyltransferase, partial [Pseudomonadota bacterium]